MTTTQPFDPVKPVSQREVAVVADEHRLVTEDLELLAEHGIDAARGVDGGQVGVSQRLQAARVASW